LLLLNWNRRNKPMLLWFLKQLEISFSQVRFWRRFFNWNLNWQTSCWNLQIPILAMSVAQTSLKRWVLRSFNRRSFSNGVFLLLLLTWIWIKRDSKDHIFRSERMRISVHPYLRAIWVLICLIGGSKWKLELIRA